MTDLIINSEQLMTTKIHSKMKTQKLFNEAYGKSEKSGKKILKAYNKCHNRYKISIKRVNASSEPETEIKNKEIDQQKLVSIELKSGIIIC